MTLAILVVSSIVIPIVTGYAIDHARMGPVAAKPTSSAAKSPSRRRSIRLRRGAGALPAVVAAS